MRSNGNEIVRFSTGTGWASASPTNTAPGQSSERSCAARATAVGNPSGSSPRSYRALASVRSLSAREVARYPMDKRIREVVEGPDGALWLLEDGKGGRLLELRPR